MSDKPNEFYVGYLAVPPGIKWAIRGLVILLLALVAFDAWLLGTLQPDAGDGRWADAPTEFKGTLSRAPYPTLRVATPAGARTYVLVSDEKRGAEAVLGGIADGAAVRIQGYEIERAAVGMIELAATSVAAAAGAPTIAAPPIEVHGRATLDGEIVDSKCWLGVMRPGEGHIHKACASLCIRGGIPPMFVTRAAEGPQVMLLTLFDGRPVPPDAILEYIADPVRLSGVVEKRGDIYLFKADLSTLTRTE
jgi:hypothetical protein